MNPSIKTFFLWVIRVCSYLILFLPLLVTQTTFFPFIFGKIVVFRGLVEVALVAWIFLVVYEKAFRPNFRHPVTFSLTLFFIAQTLAMLFGENISESFWSTQERMTGMLTMYHFYAWFLIMTSCFHTWKEWRRILFAGLVASVGVGLVGFSQKAAAANEAIRITATIGNPIYVAIFSTFWVLLSVFLFLKERFFLHRLALIFFLLFNTVVLFFAASRGATFSLVAALFLLCSIAIVLLPYKKTRMALGALYLFFILFFAGSSVWFTTQSGDAWRRAHLPPELVRLTSNPFTDEGRLTLWGIGIQGFLERPLLGWGWENFNAVFYKYYKGVQYHMFQDTWYDRSHNQHVDILVFSGVVGFLAYLLMWGSLFWVLGKKMRVESSFRVRLSLLVLAAILLWYLLQNMTVFDSPVSLFILYVIFGMIVFLTSQKQKKEEEISSSTELFSGVPFPFVFFPAVTVALLALTFFNIQPALQSTAGLKAMFVSDSNIQFGVELFRSVLRNPSPIVDEELRTHLGISVVDAIESGKVAEGQAREALSFAVAETQKNILSKPYILRPYIVLSHLYRVGSRYDSSYSEKAVELIQKALTISPERQQLFIELSDIYRLRGENARSQEQLERIIALDETEGDIHSMVALRYLWLKNYEQALYHIQEANRLGVAFSSMEQLIFQTSSEMPLSEQNADLFGGVITKALSEAPTNHYFLSSHTLWLAKQGRLKESNETLEIIKKNYPSIVKDLETLLEKVNGVKTVTTTP